ncbi:Activator of Hsp90 ATPase homolog 1-like protein [Aliiroseovarius sediminilitoris]|uniref:Activator of Hsp90 ATPase homolog 1-like protein n=1 Tax=Aliiroseovarius sediminilitoris TaxID=1173584 RepID=A0A1I0QNT1_9RHOB|nr:SRPBCC domain-containing protein [Aliiroseovarius sediminilitoris]SEW28833.1 Activator of Hsp90 ATPase homolog 1-like protein [Aliiroseovarius sediminilitoris]
MTDPIVKKVNVACDPDRAFDVFVNRTTSWWPLGGHAVSAGQGKAALAVTIEPRVGGAVYETMFDGARTDWGKVLVFEAGRKLSMTWHPGNNADAPTRVDVEFEGLGDGTTRVTLTHSGWEVWGEDADTRRGSYDGGWDNVFGICYAAAFAD